MKAKTLHIGGCSVYVLPVIKGLLSESKKVEQAFTSLQPDLLALSISKEELDGLKNLPEDFEPELTRYEEIYAKGLGRFGEVAAPPPCYVAALELAEHDRIPIVAVDLDEASYTDLYCASVPGTTLFRHSIRTWILKRRTFGAETPEDFVLAWDRTVNKLDGFDIVEEKRADAIAAGIDAASKKSRRLLALVELERAGDVFSRLSRRSDLQ